MADFVLRSRCYDEIPQLLLEEVPGFRESEEFNRLNPKLRKTPGIVCGAFKDYLVRLQEAEANGIANHQMSIALEKAYDMIEKLAASPDPDVQNLLIVEIFEHLWSSEKVLDIVKQRLRPRSLALYKQWIR